MNEHGNYKFMGDDPFCWFTGIIEDINDPLEAGRVKVRCYGIHSKNPTAVQREHLPWAIVLSPTTSASVSGIGSTPHGLVQGSQVVGFFRDGSSAQHPVIMGTIPSIPSQSPDPTKGFNDPDGVYPREDRLNQPDINKLAGMSHAESEFRTIRTAALIENIETAKGETWSELDSNAAPTYPKNHVIETIAGHVIEIDSSDGSERIHLRHTSGTYIEILPDGSVAQKTIGSEHKIVLKDENLLVNGKINITGNSEATAKIENDVTVKVVNGDVNITVDAGDANVTVNGNANMKVTGNMDLDVDGNMTENIGGDKTSVIGGKNEKTVSGNFRVRAGRIDLN